MWEKNYRVKSQRKYIYFYIAIFFFSRTWCHKRVKYSLVFCKAYIEPLIGHNSWHFINLKTSISVEWGQHNCYITFLPSVRAFYLEKQVFVNFSVQYTRRYVKINIMHSQDWMCLFFIVIVDTTCASVTQEFWKQSRL